MVVRMLTRHASARKVIDGVTLNRASGLLLRSLSTASARITYVDRRFIISNLRPIGVFVDLQLGSDHCFVKLFNRILLYENRLHHAPEFDVRKPRIRRETALHVRLYRFAGILN